MEKIIIVFLCILCPLLCSGFNITLPPITFCDLTSGRRMSIAHCLSSCMGVYNMNMPVKTTIYQSSTPINVNVAKCKKIRKITTYTETWTFSRIQTIKMEEKLDPDYNGCMESWSTKCQKGLCSTSPPEEIPEYHWASDTTTDITYYLIDSHLSHTYTYFNSSLYLISPNGLTKFKTGYQYGSKDEKILTIWDPDSPIGDGCPIRGGHSIICYPGSSGLLYCPGEGITISTKVALNVSECYITAYYDKGMIFNFVNSSSQGGMYPISVTTEDQKVNEFSESVRMAFQTRDALGCSTTCMSLGIIANSSIFRINSQLYYKINSTDYAYCYQDPTCVITPPFIRCGDENKILVSCGHVSYWWKTNSSINVRSETCHSPQNTSSSELTLEAGGETIVLNRSGLYWEVSKDPEIPLFGPIKGTNILDMSKVVLSDVITKGAAYNATISDSSKQVAIDIPGYSVFESIANWVHDLNHQIKVWIVIIMASVSFLVMAFQLTLKKRARRINSTYTIVQPLEDTTLRPITIHT
ncbi:TPA_asm: G [Schiedea betacytorhabdovirus 1]|nr:TPA_asm: G [Schiedea betacytorhabdovirus 1]